MDKQYGTRSLRTASLGTIVLMKIFRALIMQFLSQIKTGSVFTCIVTNIYVSRWNLVLRTCTGPRSRAPVRGWPLWPPWSPGRSWSRGRGTPHPLPPHPSPQPTGRTPVGMRPPHNQRYIHKTSGYKTSGLQNVRFTKRQVFKTSCCKKNIHIYSVLVVGDGCVLFTILKGFLCHISP